jgi:DNA helicase HerA-like ATPase
MPEPLLIARAVHDLVLLPGLANRHGLITGATGTGKTVTLQNRMQPAQRRRQRTARPAGGGGIMNTLGEVLPGKTGPRGGHHQGILDAAAKSAARAIGSQVGREIVRGVLGGILGGGRKR